MHAIDSSNLDGENAVYDFNVNDLYSSMKSRHQSAVSKSSNDDNEQLKPLPSSSDQTAAKKKINANKQTAKNNPAKKSSSSTNTKKRGHPRKQTAPPPPAKVSPLPHTAADNNDPPNANNNADDDDNEESSPMISQSDAIDEILTESDDLLRAAHEAQSLGRLVAAQSYLYLAHARLVGLGQWLEPSRDDDGGRVSPSSSSSLPWEEEEEAAITEMNDTARPRSSTHRENISDSLAHSAKELLHKHAGVGMQYNADVERKRNGRKKKKMANNEVGSSCCHSNNSITKNHNLTAHGEITSKPLSMVGGEADESSGRVVVPSVLPRTVLNCAHLDAQRLVQTGIDT